jgi:hypothetical protein
MLTISKNLVWPRDLESFKGGNFNTLSLVDCYVQICNGKKKQTKRKQTKKKYKKKLKIFLYDSLVLYLTKKWLNS